jgi:hypothetical protein
MSRRISDDLAAAIRAAVYSVVPEAEIDRIEIEERLDEEGEPTIRIHIWHQANGQEFNTLILRRTRDAVFDNLYDRGERRYPYLRHHIPDNRRVTEPA